jgi:hypothetical protein
VVRTKISASVAPSNFAIAYRIRYMMRRLAIARGLVRDAKWPVGQARALR